MWWRLQTPPDPFAAAFSFLPALPREEAAAALRNRAQLLRAAHESMRASLDSDWVRKSKPVHVGWMFELWMARAEAESGWCERIAERIDSGVSYLPDQLAEAAGWGAMRAQTEALAEPRGAERPESGDTNRGVFGDE